MSDAARREGENPWRKPARPLVPSRVEAIVLAAVVAAACLLAVPMYFPQLLWKRAALALPTDYRPDRANGAYLAQIGGCIYCHMAAEADSPPLAGGRRVRTPFGTLHAPNITPHRNAGIGGWSGRDFIAAMRYGLSPANRHYYPAFPYTSYAGMAVTDLLDLKHYLDGVAPSGNRPAQTSLAFPFSIRPGIGLWKLAHFSIPEEVMTAPGEGTARGRYLTNSVAHCGECHTPRTVSAGLIRSRSMAGTGARDVNPNVPNITPHRSGIGTWSREALIAYLKTGIRPDGQRTGGAMAAVVEHMTSRLTASDREAMANYLLSLPALPSD